MKLDKFNIYLSKKFMKLGIFVAKHPSYFIIIPIFLSALLGTGLQKWYNKNNIKFLIAPDNTRHVKEEMRIEKLFPMNLSSTANMERMNREPCNAAVIITSKDGGSVIRHHVYKEILQLDKFIQNITIKTIKNLKYQDLCAKNNNECFKNSILKMEERNYSLKYPLNRVGKYEFNLNSLFLGGVEINEDNYVKNAKAMTLYYYLNDESNFHESNAKQWQNLFLETVLSNNFKYINVDRYTSIAPEQELSKLIFRIFLRMPVAMISIIIFSILTCLYNNWIESKPWTGSIAVISGGLALVSSFGLIMYFNTPFIAAAGSVPLLILGICIDDAFILLAAWKRTDSNKNVENRLGEAYSESAISITITSLTNFVAFSSGIFSAYRIVKYFCLYATVAVFFCYIYQLTFVGACMAICGHLEKKNRHSLIFFQFEKNEKQSFIERILFYDEALKSVENNKNIIPTIWMKLGNFLTLWPAKLIALLVLTSHIAIGLYGITQIDIVGKYTDSVALDSNLFQFYQKNFKYFSKYKFRFQIIIDGKVNYANMLIQKQIENIFSDLENASLIDDSLTESWLRFYLKFLKDERIAAVAKGYNISNEKDFITVLRQAFLHHPAAKHFRNDIAFNSDYTSIIGSRFLCQTLQVADERGFISTFQKIRKITDKVRFTVFPYTCHNYWIDDAELHIKFTIQMLTSISIIVIIICFVFIPDIITTVSVTFSVISTEICTLGYMTLWNVELAPVSIIVLVMCAGFSVDNSTHFSHTFRQNKHEDPNERLRSSINCIGLAIFQGSATTIISILPLAFPVAFIFVTIFKIMFLVILFSFMNALIFLPVILTSLLIVKEKICTSTIKINENTNKLRNTCENLNLGFHSSEF